MYEYDPTPFRGVFERDFGYLAGVARNATRFADRPALGEAEGVRSWTYAELWRDVERLAAEFAARAASGPARRSSSSSSTGPSSP